MLIQKLKSIFRLLPNKKKKMFIPGSTEPTHTKTGNTTLQYHRNRNNNFAETIAASTSENEWWIN